MRFSTVLLAFLPACLAMPSYAPRQEVSRANELLQTINDLSKATAKLTAAVNAFDNQWFDVIQGLIRIAFAEAQVDGTTLLATSWALASANFTAAESSQVVNALAGQIGPTQGSLQALENKAPQLKSIPLDIGDSAVLLDLNLLKKHTDGFIDAVTAKVTPDQAGLLGFGKSILDQSFLTAINAF